MLGTVRWTAEAHKGIKMRVLLIDDTRSEDAPNIMRRIDLIARNYWSGIDAIVKMGPWDLLLLDHDLNCFVTGVTTPDSKKEVQISPIEFTGYSIMCFLEANPEYLPGKIEIVSSNPVGRKRMQMVIDKLYKKDGV